ncbi:MAG: hypothetical protein FWH04_05365 [Oscillospiraceae bacterium]|nr:hypothetical protein [Oscillospiraceae bacterium]
MKFFWIRILNMLAGIILYAFGIAATINANVGYAPWEVFHAGLADAVGLSIGAASIISGIAIVAMVTALGEKLGLGTIASMILTGVFIDAIFTFNMIPRAENPIIGMILLITGLFIISIGSYLYIKSAFGVGPRDNLMVVLSRKSNIPVGACRGIVEALATLIGWFLGGTVGIGTIVSAIAAGFCVQITFWVLKFDVTAIKHETLGDTYKALVDRRRKT